ncbi:hypothetical protein HHK36_000657 [Tetracentron sinense]|uniref:Uncharacterized protein n=1 Tax=Tetracentron sinense TaxID=13715 RepID=A0A834ZRY4_TETSI|nr:hypothetical protein HHK36_000657 [Tetracentron sinense]
MSFIRISLINSYAQDIKIDVLQSVDQQKLYFQISSLQIDNQLQSGALSCPDSTLPIVYENHNNNPSLPSVVPIGAPWQQVFLLARRQKKIYVEVFDLAPIKLTLSFSGCLEMEVIPDHNLLFISAALLFSVGTLPFGWILQFWTEVAQMVVPCTYELVVRDENPCTKELQRFVSNVVTVGGSRQIVSEPPYLGHRWGRTYFGAHLGSSVVSTIGLRWKYLRAIYIFINFSFFPSHLYTSPFN